MDESPAPGPAHRLTVFDFRQTVQQGTPYRAGPSLEA